MTLTKNNNRMLMILGFLILILPLFAQFGGGSGTSSNPYKIANIYHLNNVRDYLSSYFIQTESIDLAVTNPARLVNWNTDTLYVVNTIRKYSNGYAYYCIQTMTANDGTQDPGNTSYWSQLWEAAKGWDPIGNQTGSPIDPSYAFTGVYDGNGMLIYNLYINRGASSCNNDVYASDGEDNNGLFGFATNTNTKHTEIKNLGLIDPNVTGRRATGSLLGKSLNPNRTPSYSYTVYVSNCYAEKSESGTASVSGFGATGGLVGANNSDRKQQVPYIRFCYAKVTVSATHPNNYASNPADYFGSPTTYNPYNIKYGGLVGCNENGVTQSCYARGNVSGGDRVGGLAGCTIDGAIFRSYSTGTVTRGITPGSWQGGIGGLVGRIDGSLPPGLGGTQGTGSVQDCYWDTQTSGTSSSAGGTGKTTTQMKTQSTFVNWDFTNVWSINAGVNDGYPQILGAPTSAFYFRTDPDAEWSKGVNWNDTSGWEYSTNGSTWSNAIVFPDLSNSISISVAHSVLLNLSISIDQCTITTDGELIIQSGNTLTVINGEGTDLTINGKLKITGSFIVGNSALVVAGSNSLITFNGSVAQSTGIGFPSPVNNMVVQNSAGISFTEAVTVNGVLSILSGSVSGAAATDGYHSTTVSYLEIDETGYNILNFAIPMNTNQANTQFIKRQWTLTGNIDDATETNRVKSFTFYWTSDDDYGYIWDTTVPILWAGSSSITPTAYNTTSNPRWLTADYTLPQSAKANVNFKIGLEEEQTLPVELSSFTCFATPQNYVMLEWVTQSETNVSGYYIYSNTEDNLDTSERINAFIEATNTSQEASYIFVDNEATPGNTWFYWLQHIEINGITEFHGPISITLSNNTNPSLIIPMHTRLLSPYPNPFNPDLIISFSMARPAPVQVLIYNIRGELVKTLINGFKNANTYRIKWDGKDDKGIPMSSGVYLIRMTSGKYSETQKAILIK